MQTQMIKFLQPFQNKDEQENGTKFAPKFDHDGLITAVITDQRSGDVLMLGYMNSDSLALTLKTGECHFWSRSRQEIWHKGATSGNVQKVSTIKTDCDQDALLIAVDVIGHSASCHTGRTSCFYREVQYDANKNTAELTFDDQFAKFDPTEIYK